MSVPNIDGQHWLKTQLLDGLWGCSCSPVSLHWGENTFSAEDFITKHENSNKMSYKTENRFSSVEYTSLYMLILIMASAAQGEKHHMHQRHTKHTHLDWKVSFHGIPGTFQNSLITRLWCFYWDVPFHQPKSSQSWAPGPPRVLFLFPLKWVPQSRSLLSFGYCPPSSNDTSNDSYTICQQQWFDVCSI